MGREYKEHVSVLQYPSFFKRMLASLIDSLLLDLTTCVIVLFFLLLLFWVRSFLSIGHTYSGGVGAFLFTPSGGSFSLAGVHPSMLQLMLVVIRLVLSLIYFVWGTFRYGTTFGKRCFRIYVVGWISPLSTPESGNWATVYSKITLRQSILRWLGYFVSYIVTIGGGYFMALFHTQKRTLHDLMGDTLCIILPLKGEYNVSLLKV